jgi:hypothetical protein
MSIMRPIRTIATALLVASLAAAGCGQSQPDQPTSAPSQPPIVITTPAPSPPNPDPTPPAPGPAARPRIMSVTTIPALPREGGFLRLPAGAGKVLFRVQAVNTQRVRFLLSPTGTDTSARLLGEDTNGSDGWTLAWGYPDEPLTAHLTVKAIGPGGTSPDTVLGLHHPDHTS